MSPAGGGSFVTVPSDWQPFPADCNHGIGNAGESIERLNAWATYLAHHRYDLRDRCISQ